MFIKSLHAEFGRWLASPKQPVIWLLLPVALYVFLAPNVDFAPHLTWHDGQRIAQLILLGVFVAGFTLPGVARAVVATWMMIPTWSRWALFAAFTLGIYSILQASLWRWALLEWAMCLLLLFVVLGVAAGMRMGGQPLQRLLVVVFYATAVAYAVKAVVIYLSMLTIGASYGMGFNIRELFTGFSNIRFFGHLQTMMLPFLLLPALWWAVSLRQRLLLSIVPVLWWMLVVASGTRGTWIALIVGILAVMVCGGPAGRRWIKWQIAALSCSLVCYPVLILLVPYLLEQPTFFLHRTQDIISLSLRGIIWSDAIEFIREHPLFGIGPMHFAYYANAVAAHPHNMILQFMAEWGIPAALMFTTVFAAGGLAFAGHVRHAIKQGDDHERLVRIALLAALTGAAAQAMVDGVLVMPVSQTVLALLCGWALGMAQTTTQEVRGASGAARSVLAITVLIAVSAVGWAVAPEIGILAERQKNYLSSTIPEPPLLPRFWALGWINR